MKYYVISGEASGDLHGSNLIKELKKIDKSADFRCWGGDLIKKETGFLVKHFKDYSYMGFFEVFLNIFKILKNLSFCKKDILNYKPDLIIYIDFPGFNLRIAKWAKKKKYKNHSASATTNVLPPTKIKSLVFAFFCAIDKAVFTLG